MFVSYRWLQEYVDIKDVTAQELADKITKSGIEVEGVEVLNKGVKGVVVGHVLECEKHPEADKLNKCLIDIGEEEPVQIICGAANIAKGLKVPVAKVGAVLPGNFKIKKQNYAGKLLTVWFVLFKSLVLMGNSLRKNMQTVSSSSQVMLKLVQMHLKF